MRRPASSKNDAHPVHRPPGLRSRDSTPRLPSYRDDCLYRRANSGSAIFIAARPQRLSNCRAIACKLPALPKTVSSLRHSNYRAVGLNRRPGGRRTGRAPFFDETRMSHRKIPASPQTAGLNWTWNVFFGYFLCAKESNSRTSAKKAPCITDTL